MKIDFSFSLFLPKIIGILTGVLNSYKILITDDEYDIEKYQKLSNIVEIDWRLIVDVGRKTAPNDLCNVIAPFIKELGSIQYFEMEEQVYTSTNEKTGLLTVKGDKKNSPFEQWKRFKEKFVPILKIICGNEHLKSVMFVLDFHSENLIRTRLIEMLWEENLIRKGSRFVCLGKAHKLPFNSNELEEKSIEYFEHEDANLEDIVSVINDYGLHRIRRNEEICLPSIDSLDGRLTKEMWNDYSSVVDLVYPGMENHLTNYTDGEDFYKGNEITWSDLAQKKDIKWNEYETWKETIVKKLQTERVAECKLIHGAGAGGTTLSKRLMWDIREIHPTLRIKKYSQDIVNVIIDIYRKTGKSVFVVLEMGSMVIAEDEFEYLKRSVNAQSCHALFLKVERTISKKENAEIYLSEDLKKEDAEHFLGKYSEMAINEERKNNLKAITYDFTQDEWRGQRCPFFYGFYTFQEEYRGINRFLEASIKQCDNGIKSILSDLAIITVYSQNICIPYEEMTRRLELEDANLVEMFKMFNEGIEKIMVQKANGFRICHPLIAKKILEVIWKEHKYYSTQLYFATFAFIRNMDYIYDQELDREYLDKVFKELFIDRSYIDGEQQKFALLINELNLNYS